jgi:hypothetical protein
MPIERVLKDTKNPRNLVRITFRDPAQLTDGTWSCQVSVRGVAGVKPIRKSVYGADSLQSLQLALEYAAQQLAPFEGRLVWDTGNSGLLRAIPMFLPLSYRRRIHRAIDAEVTRWASNSKRRHGRSTRPRRRGKPAV